MSRFLRLMFSTRALLVLLAVMLLVTLVVLGSWPMPYKLAAAVGVLAFGVVFGLVRWAWRRRRSRRGAAGLEQALESDMDRAVHAGPSGAEAEMLELRSHLHEALRTIRTSDLGRRSGKAALYELPWHMLIGHSSAGKSTAVMQSGLNFPLPCPQGQGLRGIGGTRNCDWFFTSEGILLDTAGRYTMEAEHRGEWMSFLGLLKQHRPKAPINGIVVATSVALLRDSPAQEVIRLARELRGRVQELTDTLEVIAPVYVLFTKADLVAGFTEFFGDYDAHEREQVWGASLPCQGEANADAVAQFDRHFDELHEGLKEAALARMGRHRGQPLPPAVLAFPLEFAALQPALRSFIATLFDENKFQVRPLFRGFYFTSAVQPAQPAAPTGAGVAQQFSLSRPQAAAAQPAASEHGFFLKNLFSGVILADRHLVRRHTSRARQRLRSVGYAAGVLALACALGAWTWSYLGNRQLVASVQADLEKAQRLQAGQLDLGSRLQALELLIDRAEDLAAWRAQRPWSVGMGLYQGESVERRLRQEVFQGLQRVMLEPVAQALEAYLREVNLRAQQPDSGARGGNDGAQVATADASAAARFMQASATDTEDAYKALKTYLMLAERQRMEPGHLTDQITRFWRGWLEDHRGTLPREQLMRSAERLISFAMSQLQDPLFPVVSSNFGLVDQTREHLRGVVQGQPAIQRVYADMKARASTRYAPMTVARIVGERDKALVAGSHVVPGTFTREAWHAYIEPAVNEAAHNELQHTDWVLRTSTRDDLSLQGSPADIYRALTELYKAEYVREWQRFMQGIAVAEFDRFDAAVEHMNRLGDVAQSPIRKLLTTLHEQTAWDNPSLLGEHARQAQTGVVEWVRQSLQRLSPVPVEVKLEANGEGRVAAASLGAVGKEFAALPRLLAARDGGASPLLDGYLQALGRLRTRLNAMKNQGDAGPPARQLMAATFEGGAGSELAEALRFVEEQMLDGAGDGVRAALRPLLLRPLMSSFAALVPPTETELNRLWAAQVLQPFQQSLAGKYPFDTSSRVEADPAEIARVFGAAGAVARFAAEALGPLVTRRGDELAPRQWAQLGLRLRPAFTQGFAAWVAAPELGAGGGTPSAAMGSPQASFQLLPLGAPGFTEYTVEIDGQVLRYRNGAANWTGFVWPKPGATPGARISGIALDGQAVEVFSAPGAYGFERLVDAAQVAKLPDGVRELRWGEGAQAIAVQYRAVTSPGPTAATTGRSGGAGLRGLSLPSLVAGADEPSATAVAKASVPGAAR